MTIESGFHAVPSIVSKTPDKSTAKRELTGNVAQIVYRNEETGHTIFKMDTQDGLIVVTGPADVKPGTPVECIGEFSQHSKYGRQFKAEAILPVLPVTALEIKKYLCSGIVKGLSPVLGEKLVSHFGEKTLRVLSNESYRLTDIAGIGEKSKERAIKAWKDHEAIYKVMWHIKRYGMGNAEAVAIHKALGGQALGIIKNNPYALTMVKGIGFSKADGIAKLTGIDSDSEYRIKAGVIHTLKAASEEGHTRQSHNGLINEAGKLLNINKDHIKTALNDLVNTNRLVRYRHKGDVWYSTPHMYETEKRIAQKIIDLNSTNPSWHGKDYQLPCGITLSPSQEAATKLAINSKVAVITGGPGVGKTTIMTTFLDVVEKQMNTKVLLCAPTGMAAERLSKTTGRQAVTIHRLLGYGQSADGINGFMYDENNQLEADLVVVDEATMVDTSLLDALLRAIPSQASLLLVGDKDQLLSVGAGDILNDLVNSGVIPVGRLTEVFRQAAGSRIVTAAHEINSGKCPLFENKPSDDFFFLKGPVESLPEHIVNLVSQDIPNKLRIPQEDIQVLTPVNKGPVGTEALNKALQGALNPSSDNKKEIMHNDYIFREGDRVMQTRNRRKTDVYNGNIGKVVKINKSSFSNSQDRLTVFFDKDHIIDYKRKDLRDLKHAWAITIHKSQGSEYPVVVIPSTKQHYSMLTRNIFYTGVTRGKQMVIMNGDISALELAVKKYRKAERNTGLMMLLQHYHSKQSPITANGDISHMAPSA